MVTSCTGILTGFEEDKKEFHNSISPFLADADVEEEEQDRIINQLWTKLKGDEVTPKNVKVQCKQLFT